MPRKRNGAPTGKPAWIDDMNDQREWNDRFITILNRDYRNLDPTISELLSDERLPQICGVKIRSYVDKNVTLYLYSLRKARGVKCKRQLEVATAGLKAAMELYAEQGKHEVVAYLSKVELELSGALERSKYAFATKRHGRDRAHSTLCETRFFIESQLQRPVTCATLANLVTAGYEAGGTPADEPITEEHIRKNLAEFEQNNPLWFNVVPALK